MDDKLHHVAVTGIVIKDGKYLITRRSLKKEPFAGQWTVPGGKVEIHDYLSKPRDTTIHWYNVLENVLRREVKEETGIDLSSVKIICVNNDKNEHAHFVTIGLFSDSFEGEPRVMEPDEITEWNWFDLDNLPQPLYFPTEKVLDNYKKNLFYRGFGFKNE